MSTPRLARNHDPGSVHAKVESEAEPGKPPTDRPEDYSLRPDSSKFLVQKQTFPHAERVLTCLSLEGLEGKELRYLARLIRHTAALSPGNYVNGCRDMPRSKSDCAEFYTAAGFNPGTVTLLVKGLPEG